MNIDALKEFISSCKITLTGESCGDIIKIVPPFEECDSTLTINSILQFQGEFGDLTRELINRCLRGDIASQISFEIYFMTESELQSYGLTEEMKKPVVEDTFKSMLQEAKQSKEGTDYGR